MLRTLLRMSFAAYGPSDATARDASAWGEQLVELTARYRVPGATLGILSDGSITTTGTGVLSKATGVEVTPDSLFQIGSITKVWTATLVMQLVDEGLLDLDAPVAWRSRSSRTAATRRISSTTSIARSSTRQRASRSPRRSSPRRRRPTSSRSSMSDATNARG